MARFSLQVMEYLDYPWVNEPKRRRSSALMPEQGKPLVHTKPMELRHPSCAGALGICSCKIENKSDDEKIVEQVWPGQRLRFLTNRGRHRRMILARALLSLAGFLARTSALQPCRVRSPLWRTWMFARVAQRTTKCRMSASVHLHRTSSPHTHR